MDIYQPYTYLIGWSTHNKWYYGVRYAKNCHPSDLWSSYFTSSKVVSKFRKHYGEPNIIEIRKVFDNENAARLWEEKVLTKLDVKNREDFLNQTNNKSIPSQKGIPKSEKHKSNLSKSRIEKGTAEGKNNPMYGKLGELSPLHNRPSHMKGKSHKQETKKKISLKLSGENNPMYGRTGINNPLYGKPGRKHTEEEKEKMRKPKLNTDKMKNKIYINNGLLNKKIHKNESIPEGWTKGRITIR